MQSHQREAGGGVIECGPIPVHGGVTSGTILREVGRLMRRVGGVVVVGLVAVPARAARQAVIVIGVALTALHAGVRARQCETGGGMIECRRTGPVDRQGSMTQRAILRKPAGFVRRIGGSVKVVQVAVDARRTGEAVVVVDVAGGARLGGMGTR